MSQATLRLDAMQGCLKAALPDEFIAPKVSPKLEEQDFVSSYGEAQFKADVVRLKNTLSLGT